jgi:hypothetical protein
LYSFVLAAPATPSASVRSLTRGTENVGVGDQAGIETATGELSFSACYRPGLLAELFEGRSPEPVRAIGSLLLN